MQVLVSLPPIEELTANGELEEALFRRICGVPLLVRVVATVLRNGGTEVLLLHPKAISQSWLSSRLNSPAVRPSQVEILALDTAFNPASPGDWLSVEGRLEPVFLWLPWNYVADRTTVRRIIEAGTNSSKGVRLSGGAGVGLPVVIAKEKLRKVGALQQYVTGEELDTIPAAGFSGIAVSSNESARHAERELVRRSGKDSDGINSKFNRWMVRPVVRWLSKTAVTPNAVTFAGLGAAAFAGYWFAHGTWESYIAGALLYFASVMFDEIDGMLARVTFRESPFGCWLETFVDYAGYILIFAGMAAGLHAEYGVHSVVEFILLMFGTLLSFALLARQRKLATDPARPQDYRMRLRRSLEANSGNFFSGLGRLFEPIMRNGAFCYVVLIFSAVDWIHAFFLSVTIGSNIVWMMVLHYNRFFRRSVAGMPLSG